MVHRSMVHRSMVRRILPYASTIDALPFSCTPVVTYPATRPPRSAKAPRAVVAVRTCPPTPLTTGVQENGSASTVPAHRRTDVHVNPSRPCGRLTHVRLPRIGASTYAARRAPKRTMDDCRTSAPAHPSIPAHGARGTGEGTARTAMLRRTMPRRLPPLSGRPRDAVVDGQSRDRDGPKPASPRRGTQGRVERARPRPPLPAIPHVRTIQTAGTDGRRGTGGDEGRAEIEQAGHGQAPFGVTVPDPTTPRRRAQPTARSRLVTSCNKA